ncbi:MAG: uracil-DNA glycosylase [Thermodesulfobacteriota bacterium]|nr:uracil-DNA glycosylase [Thermodesulfobacteriota bacterium]
MKKNKRINCHNCCHFYITWDPDFPCGCRAMGFKGKQLPSTTVLRSTGKPCMLFKKKTKKTDIP